MSNGALTFEANAQLKKEANPVQFFVFLGAREKVGKRLASEAERRASCLV